MTSDSAAILSMSGQAWLFLSTVLAGACIGLFYDFFRIFRKTAPKLNASWVVQLEDLFFWLIVTFGMFYFMLNQNFGEIRLFSIMGAFLGIVLYFAALSRFVILVSVTVVEFLKKVVTSAVRIILLPFKTIANWLAPPINTLLQKIRSGLYRFSRYVKIRLRKTARNWFIFRKKV
jgi:spore cortex biosynthesis protein YabQ